MPIAQIFGTPESIRDRSEKIIASFVVDDHRISSAAIRNVAAPFFKVVFVIDVERIAVRFGCLGLCKTQRRDHDCCDIIDAHCRELASASLICGPSNNATAFFAAVGFSATAQVSPMLKMMFGLTAGLWAAAAEKLTGAQTKNASSLTPQTSRVQSNFRRREPFTIIALQNFLVG